MSNVESIISSIVFMFVLLILIIWIYMLYAPIDKYQQYKQEKIKETMNWLYSTVNRICNICNMNPVYTIVETNHITHIEHTPHKSIIYLMIWNERYDRVFSHNTLLYATLHEITHILSPSDDHDEPFDKIENILLNTAIDLGYYDPTIPLETNYITFDSL